MPCEDDFVHIVSKVVSSINLLYGNNTLALYNPEAEFQFTFRWLISICTNRSTAHTLRKPASLGARLPAKGFDKRGICVAGCELIGQT